MATKAKTPAAVVPSALNLSLTDKVTEAFEEYQKTTGAILDDYVIGNRDMFTELAEADDGFKTSLTELIDENEVTNKDLISRLKERMDDVEIETDDVLNMIDEGEIIDYLKKENYLVIKVENLSEQMELEAFVNANIYPYNLGESHNL
jgi:hypothetical protein